MEALLASAGGGPGGGRGGGGRTPGGSIMAGMPGMPSIGGAPMGGMGCAAGVMRMATPFSICSPEQLGMVGTLTEQNSDPRTTHTVLGALRSSVGSVRLVTVTSLCPQW